MKISQMIGAVLRSAKRFQLFILRSIILLILNPAVLWSNTHDSDGYVFIDFTDYNDNPVVEIPMVVVDTLNNGNMFFSSNREEYSLKLPPGYYYMYPLLAPMKTVYSDWFHLEGGDSLEFSFQYQTISGSEENRWPLYEPVRQDTLLLSFSGAGSYSFDGFSVYSNRVELRGTLIEYDTYEVIYDSRYPEIFWNLPNLADRPYRISYREYFNNPILTVDIDIPYNHAMDSIISAISTDDPLAVANLTVDEWISPEYTMNRTVIDPTYWGDVNLSGYGYVDGRAYFDHADDDETWRVVCAFHEKVVVLKEDFDPIEYELDVGMTRAAFSPNGRYLFYFDATDSLDIDNWARMLDTETGDLVSFQKLPFELSVSDIPTQYSSIHSCQMTTSWWTHLPAMDGTLVSVFEDSFKYYNDQLEYERACSLPGEFRTGYTRRHRSSDGDILYLINASQRHELCALDRYGLVIYTCPVNSWRLDTDLDPTVLSVLSDTSIHIWDLSDGSLILQESVNGFGGMTLSSDGGLIGLARDGEYFEIRSIDTWELVNSFNFSSDSTYRIRYNSVANNGTSLLHMQNLDGNRTALVFSSGDLVWVSALRSTGYRNGRIGASISSSPENLKALSNDGNCFIYNDGCNIHIMEFERIGD